MQVKQVAIDKVVASLREFGWRQTIVVETEMTTEVFAENDVDFRALPHLTEQDLKDLGVFCKIR